MAATSAVSAPWRARGGLRLAFASLLVLGGCVMSGRSSLPQGPLGLAELAGRGDARRNASMQAEEFIPGQYQFRITAPREPARNGH